MKVHSSWVEVKWKDNLTTWKHELVVTELADFAQISTHLL